MSIKPWNEKQLFAMPKIWDATDDLEAAIKGKEILFQTEADAKRNRCYKARPVNIKPIWIEGEKRAGKPTRHFAWVGLPKNADGKKVPAMVLVHGGGGTAFLRWVERWNKRGYAAIAMDTCGHLPVAKEYQEWVGHEYLPSWDWGEFAGADKPAKQQWIYHAVTGVIRSHTYLRSLPEIDNRKIGITGISWGGFLTSIASSIDSRFRCGAPVYGCGFLEHDSPWVEPLEKVGGKKAKRWIKLWDPKQYLPLSKVPTLWATGSNDFAYNLEMLQLSRQACGAKAMASVHIRAGHSHRAGWKLNEQYTFIDSYCKGAPKLMPPKVKVKGNTVEVKNSDIEKAVLCYTKDSKRLPERYWKRRMMKKNSAGKFAIELPPEIAGWFVNVKDANGNLTTSDIKLL